LAEVVERGGRVRVITTTYMGATEKRAVDELFALGAEVRVALDARTTKLHAKAWLLERESGLTTAFVGRRTSRTPRCSTGWSGTSACHRWMPRT
jgi:HKD family nuclease